MALTKETVVGLDLGSDRVSMAQVGTSSRGQSILRHAGWASLAPGLDVEGTAAVLRDLWREHRLSCYSVATCLRSDSLVVRHFRFPSLGDDELAAALLLEAEEVLQLEPEQIVTDWHENYFVDAASGGNMGREGILAALPKGELDQHLAILDAAGLAPTVVDVGCAALGNAYVGLRGDECEERAICLVNLAGRSVDVAILFGKSAMYPRSIRDIGEGERRDRRLADSLTDVIKYYEFKLRRKPPTDVVVTGQAPAMDGLCTCLRERVGLTVSLWDPCCDMKLSSAGVRRLLESSPERGASLTTAIGAAMRR